jgi:hypothetical protein
MWAARQRRSQKLPMQNLGLFWPLLWIAGEVQNLCQESLQNGMTSKNHFNTGPVLSAIASANGAGNRVACNPRNSLMG